jgi:MoxR-like ATPase
VRNPLLLVDDVDRAPADERNGTVPAVLLGLLEPESARDYEDPLLAVPADLSAVNWLLTANSVDPLPDALLDRLLRIEVPPPSPSALGGIVAAMTDGIAAELGIGRDALPELPAEVHHVLAEAFAADRGALRRIRLGLRAALGAAALGDDAVAAAHAALGVTTAPPVGFPRTATPAR